MGKLIIWQHFHLLNCLPKMYTNDVVKVTLQIGEPEAMQLKMDVAITFADHCITVRPL